MLFHLFDDMRRQRGRFLERLGWGPEETPFRIAASKPAWRLRNYQFGEQRMAGRGAAVLILPAPFKRAYIWDLRPQVSVVRRLLQAGLQVYLLEWLDAAAIGDWGLEHFADAFPREASEIIAAETGASKIVLAGHSLGGTFAAIFATRRPERIDRLWLVDAPLVFGGDCGGPIAEYVRVIGPKNLETGSDRRGAAGSYITSVSIAALPGDFILGPLVDRAASVGDLEALAIHMAVLRWTQDELALPARLFAEVLEQLYRDDAFARGALQVGARTTGLERLRAPVAAIVNTASGVVPPASLLRGLELAPEASARVYRFEAASGCAIQHLGPLVAPRAHATLWPDLLQSEFPGLDNLR